jgi:hypothetical protein
MLSLLTLPAVSLVFGKVSVSFNLRLVYCVRIAMTVVKLAEPVVLCNGESYSGFALWQDESIEFLGVYKICSSSLVFEC